MAKSAWRVGKTLNHNRLSQDQNNYFQKRDIYRWIECEARSKTTNAGEKHSYFIEYAGAKLDVFLVQGLQLFER